MRTSQVQRALALVRPIVYGVPGHRVHVSLEAAVHVADPRDRASEPDVGDGTWYVVQGRGRRRPPLQLPGHVLCAVERPRVQVCPKGFPVYAGVRISSLSKGVVQLVHRKLGREPRRALPHRRD